MQVRSTFMLALALTLFTAACSKPESDSAAKDESAAATTGTESMTTGSNPFFSESDHYLKYPAFDRIGTEHYAPAFEKGMADHMAEIEAIANLEDAPTFDNTLVAMERSGQMLDRVTSVFSAMTSAHTNDDLNSIDSDMAPKLSAHSDQIFLNEKLKKSEKTIC